MDANETQDPPAQAKQMLQQVMPFLEKSPISLEARKNENSIRLKLYIEKDTIINLKTLRFQLRGKGIMIHSIPKEQSWTLEGAPIKMK